MPLLRLDLKVSRVERAVFLLSHLAAGSGLCLSAIPAALRLTLLLLSGLGLVGWLLRQRSGESTATTLFLGKCIVRVATKRGVRRYRMISVGQCGDALTLLTLKSETADDGLNPFRGGLRQVLLLPDSLGPGQPRRLRAFLRMPG